MVRGKRRWVLIVLAAAGIGMAIHASWHCNRNLKGYSCIAPLWWCHPDFLGHPHCHTIFELGQFGHVH
jgi:hypothetical protein